jgi:hypothetical protein
MFETSKKLIAMKKLLTILSISFLPVCSFAQKGVDFVDGWLEFKKGDTIRGKVCYINTVTGERYDKVFLLNEAGSKKRFGSDKINSLMADGKIMSLSLLKALVLDQCSCKE